MKKLINLIALLFLTTTIMYGATVTVTSSADAGAGTLRDAITTTALDGDSIVIQDDINEIVLTTSSISISTSKNLSIEGQGCVVRVTDPGISGFRCLSFNYGSFKSVSLYNLTFKGGRIELQSADAAFGGCIYSKRTHLKMYNCTLSDAYAKKGGALSDCSTATQSGSMSLYNCVFTNNTATDTGGGVCITGNIGETYTLSNCTFDGNKGVGSGSTAFYTPRPATITGCTFRNNISAKVDPSSSDIRCAALSIEHSTGTSTVENCLFDGNYSQANSITRNVGGTALTHYNRGNFGNTGSLIIKNSTFANNKGGKAAVYLRDGNTTIVNCTFTGNRSGDPAYSGAICMKDSLNNNTLTFVNNILAYNYAANTYNTYGNTSDMYVLPALVSSVSGSNNMIAVTASDLSALANPVTFTYDGVDPANDSPLFATYTTNADSKKVSVIDATTGTVPLLATTSVAIAAGVGASDVTYGSLIPANDKRGIARASIPCIGSYEYKGVTTNVNETRVNKLKYWSSEGTLSLISEVNQKANLFNVNGQLINELQLNAGVNTISGFAKGFYFLNNQKIIIK